MPQDIIEEVMSYAWTGNARELKMTLSTLHTMFGEDGVGAEHVRLTFYLEGRNIRTGNVAGAKDKKALRRVESLRHLKKVNEVVNSINTAVTACLDKQKINKSRFETVQTSLSSHINGLEMLCRHPSFFNSESTFSRVYNFIGKLRYFQDLTDQGAKKAKEYWNGKIVKELELTISAILKELGSVGDRS